MEVPLVAMTGGSNVGVCALRGSLNYWGRYEVACQIVQLVVHLEGQGPRGSLYCDASAILPSRTLMEESWPECYECNELLASDGVLQQTGLSE